MNTRWAQVAAFKDSAAPVAFDAVDACTRCSMFCHGDHMSYVQACRAEFDSLRTSVPGRPWTVEVISVVHLQSLGVYGRKGSTRLYAHLHHNLTLASTHPSERAMLQEVRVSSALLLPPEKQQHLLQLAS